jgi:hypothetical protein
MYRAYNYVQYTIHRDDNKYHIASLCISCAILYIILECTPSTY